MWEYLQFDENYGWISWDQYPYIRKPSITPSSPPYSGLVLHLSTWMQKCPKDPKKFIRQYNQITAPTNAQKGSSNSSKWNPISSFIITQEPFCKNTKRNTKIPKNQKPNHPLTFHQLIRKNTQMVQNSSSKNTNFNQIAKSKFFFSRNGPDNMGISGEHSKKRDFAESCGWNSFFILVKTGLLESNNFARCFLSCSVNFPVSSFPHLLQLLKSIHFFSLFCSRARIWSVLVCFCLWEMRIKKKNLRMDGQIKRSDFWNSKSWLDGLSFR